MIYNLFHHLSYCYSEHNAKIREWLRKCIKYYIIYLKLYIKIHNVLNKLGNFHRITVCNVQLCKTCIFNKTFFSVMKSCKHNYETKISTNKK